MVIRCIVNPIVRIEISYETNASILKILNLDPYKVLDVITSTAIYAPKNVIALRNHTKLSINITLDFTKLKYRTKPITAYIEIEQVITTTRRLL